MHKLHVKQGFGTQDGLHFTRAMHPMTEKYDQNASLNSLMDSPFGLHFDGL